jgi:hypothetical protein
MNSASVLAINFYVRGTVEKQQVDLYSTAPFTVKEGNSEKVKLFEYKKILPSFPKS